MKCKSCGWQHDTTMQTVPKRCDSCGHELKDNNPRKHHSILTDIVCSLNEQFSKIDNMSYEDWQDLDLFAEESLTKEEYVRFNKMLTVQITIR